MKSQEEEQLRTGEGPDKQESGAGKPAGPCGTAGGGGGAGVLCTPGQQGGLGWEEGGQDPSTLSPILTLQLTSSNSVRKTEERGKARRKVS